MALIRCNRCGNMVSEHAATCPRCGNPIKGVTPAPGYYQANQMPPPHPVYVQVYQTPMPPPYTQPKSPVVAGLLALFLGGFGIHYFYMGKPVPGIIFLLFCWTLIPAIIAFLQAIIYFCTSEEQFNRKYVNN